MVSRTQKSEIWHPQRAKGQTDKPFAIMFFGRSKSYRINTWLATHKNQIVSSFSHHFDHSSIMFSSCFKMCSIIFSEFVPVCSSCFSSCSTISHNCSWCFHHLPHFYDFFYQVFSMFPNVSSCFHHFPSGFCPFQPINGGSAPWAYKRPWAWTQKHNKPPPRPRPGPGQGWLESLDHLLIQYY